MMAQHSSKRDRAPGQEQNADRDDHTKIEQARDTDLPDWCSVLDGLCDEQVAALEEILRQRADLTRPS